MQEVALWAAGSMSLTETLCRKHCSGKGAVFLVRYGRSGCEPCEGTVKNPAVRILLEYQYFGKDPAPLICLPNVLLHFQLSMSLFPVLNYRASYS